MVLIRTRKITSDKHRIVSYHASPANLTEEQKKGTYEVVDIPVREQKVGKSSFLYFNPQTNETWVEYEDRPLSEEESASTEGQQKVEDELLEELMARGVL